MTYFLQDKGNGGIKMGSWVLAMWLWKIYWNFLPWVFDSEIWGKKKISWLVLWLLNKMTFKHLENYQYAINVKVIRGKIQNNMKKIIWYHKIKYVGIWLSDTKNCFRKCLLKFPSVCLFLVLNFKRIARNFKKQFSLNMGCI